MAEHVELEDEHDNLLYVSFGGKGGAYTIGYTHCIHPEIGFGIAGSYFQVANEKLTTIVPHFSGRPWHKGAHALFIDAGPQLMWYRSRSPVALLEDETKFGIGGQVSVGYEFHNGFLFRPFLMGVVGAQQQRATLWGGIDIGVSW